jgi:acetoin utilization deacetylase AcuC-like enzyme
MLGGCGGGKPSAKGGKPGVSSEKESGAKVGFVYDPAYLEHKTTPGHPERPERLTAIVKRLKETKLLDGLVELKPAPAPLEWIRTVHQDDYVKRARESCAKGVAFLDCMDVPISEKSYETALLAAGAGIAAVDAVASGKVKSAFCAVRPPGHHAEPDAAMGFCIFNNIAIAARYAQKKHKLARVLIVDFDVHHGNSTQAVFYADATVLHFGIHRHPFYPGTGAAELKGKGDGEGLNINVPLPPLSGIAAYRKAFKEKLKPAALKFKPDIVLISAGFDAHEDDPLGGMDLSSADFGELTSIIKEIADATCKGRIVSFLEGGYDLKGLSTAVEAHIKALQKQ